MDEVSFILMEVDAIRREDSLGDITSLDFFHVDWPSEIPLISINIDDHIGMVMDSIGLRSEKGSEKYDHTDAYESSETSKYEWEVCFFHRIMRGQGLGT